MVEFISENETSAPVLDTKSSSPAPTATSSPAPVEISSQDIVEVVVGGLREFDDEYVTLENQLNEKIFALKQAFRSEVAPLLTKRSEVLLSQEVGHCEESDPSVSVAKATPVLPGFWVQALSNCPDFEDFIQEYDEDVLEYLQDITVEQMTETDEETETEKDNGFKILFHFVPNPYFTNSTLVKTYHAGDTHPYYTTAGVTEITSTEIDWKEDMDVTVERVEQKKRKTGGGKKKKNQNKSKVTLVPRDSFFRFFVSLGPEHDLPVDIKDPEEEDEEDYSDDESEMDPIEKLQMYMSDDYEQAQCLRDSIVPHGIRWFTNEANEFGEDFCEEECQVGCCHNENSDEEESDEEESDDEEIGDEKPKQECKQQ